MTRFEQRLLSDISVAPGFSGAYSCVLCVSLKINIMWINIMI